MKRFIAIFILLLAMSLGASAQYSYTTTSLTVTTSTATPSGHVEVDYYSAFYYYVQLFGGTYHNCNYSCSYSQLTEGHWVYGTSSANYSYSGSGAPNTWYTVWAEPYLVEFYSVQVDSTIEYEDPYGFSVVNASGGSPSIYEFPSHTFTYTYSNTIQLDYAWSAALSPSIVPLAPTIYWITPAQGLVGDSVLITIYGTGFDFSSYITADSGVSGTIQSVSSSQIVAILTINGYDPGGSTNIYVNAQVQRSNGAPFYKQIPSNSSVLSTLALPPWYYGCQPINTIGLPDYGLLISVFYQVLDQQGLPIRSSSMRPQEQDLGLVFNGAPPVDPNPTWGDLLGGTSPITRGQMFTSSRGTFQDAPYGTCAAVPFVETVTQPISVLVGTQRYLIRTNHFTTTGPAIISGHTYNWSRDIDVSTP